MVDDLSPDVDVDAVQAAATEVAGVKATALTTAPSVPGARKMFPSPTKYEGHKWATKINGLLDKADSAPTGSMLADPAKTVMVGECAMATGEAFGLTAPGDEVPIHPGWLLMCALIAYLVIIGIQIWMNKSKPAAPTPERRAALADLA